MALPAVAAAIGGSFVTGLAGYLGASRQNRMQREMMREQMDFQERMSSTAYQRSMADMRKAGLNPMLAYMQGGASSPSGSMAPMQDEIGPAVSSAQHNRRLNQELKLLKASTEREYSAGLKNRADAEVAHRTAQNVTEQNWLIREDVKMRQLENLLLRLATPRAKNLADLEDSRFGKIMPYLERFMNMLPSMSLKGGHTFNRTVNLPQRRR